MILRDYQKQMCDDIYRRILTHNILAVLPTGGGKTVIISEIIKRFSWMQTVVIAHRKELITQISSSLARCGIYHRFIASKSTIELCVDEHMREFGSSYYNDDAKCTVISVDTIIRRELPELWLNKVGLWVIDEAHHVLPTNKWGKALAQFPNAKGLGVTATPCRADRKSLGGVFERLVIGPTMRDLINLGYLSDYKIFAPSNDLNVSDVKITASGDFNSRFLAKVVLDSKIVGDAVEHFKRHVSQGQGITFCVDVECSMQTSKSYNQAGITSEVVTAKTPERQRIDIIRAFRNGDIQQLVNVDIFGEGFDVPNVTSVTMLRPTASYNIWSQSFGRALRILEGKSHAIILDHVGNVHRHGLPDMRNDWTLNTPTRRKLHASTMSSVSVCVHCCAAYQRFQVRCPYCGLEQPVAKRRTIEQVSGDLHEMSEDDIRKLKAKIDKINMSHESLARELRVKNVPYLGVLKNLATHRNDQHAQYALRPLIDSWLAKSDTDIRVAQRKFYLTFGVDVLTAQGLRCEAAKDLRTRIVNERRTGCSEQSKTTSYT